ncbi:hypothetical protein O6H91_03G010800 [Diphasiastrum complanatum]|uniref:Uncharacterized protein n=1 Tax=Diphasiastrum complanatum TaxID=34168 RepID=A0ACC2E3C3_DIPCM|nr:hypothetical protein O6H91_03G010800 [Diphasiastrum complanatum]
MIIWRLLPLPGNSDSLPFGIAAQKLPVCCFHMAMMKYAKSLLLSFFTIVVVLASSAQGVTDSQDASALSILYSSLNSPQLSGWKANGGDPCGESWQGVGCKGSSITSIKLAGHNLGGSLGYALDKLNNLLVLDFSNNQIGSALPYQLPPHIQELYLNNNQLSGTVPYSLKSLSALTHLNLGNNHLNDQIPDVFQALNSLSSLDLSSNQLTGALPSSFANLGSLSTLHLQDNQLSGSINVLGQLSLQDVNIENNRFTGWVPASLLTIPNFRDGGNLFNNSPAPPPPPFTPPPPGSHSPRGGNSPPKGTGNNGNTQGNTTSFWTGGRLAGIIIAVILGIVAVGLLLVYFFWKKRGLTEDEEKQSHATWLRPLGGISPVKEQPEELLDNFSVEKFLKPPPERTKVPTGKDRSPIKATSGKVSKVQVTATAFSVADLQIATNSFSQENLIGEGTLGRVYRGELPNGKLLAVKKLDTSASSVQNEDEFLSIVSSIARLRHTNIVELIGHCTEYGQRLLVYEYIKRGTLHDMLHAADENTKQLSWNQRVKIAMGAARALEYLHEVCSPAAIHRNFKSANILLDEEFNPHLADCGIAALSSFGSERQVSAQLLGSFGYSAPEYAMSGIYTAKSDVYSFGVVMLELLTGRKPLDRTRTQQSLVRWATPQLHDIDALSKMVDPALKGIYPAKSLSRFADIISLCVQPEPEFRPPMSEVVQALVRLMQRASLSKRKSGDDLGASQRTLDHSEVPDSYA